jgi:hypothetical protein
VADAVSCVEYLAKKDLIGPNRVGDYTTFGRRICCASIQMSGLPGERNRGFLICKLHSMKPNKSESQYLQLLCFEADTSPEDAERMIEEQSPIHWTQNIRAPILILSGEVDEIVPPATHL